MSEEKEAANREFRYVPLEDIIVEEQVRSRIDTESESFNALMESIRGRGVLEPVLAIEKDGKYLLLCGERRVLACQKLGLKSVPVRIVDKVNEKKEILAYQLTENLQREDLSHLDEAKGIFALIQARHPDKEYDAKGVISELVGYDRNPKDASEGFPETVSEIVKIVGKTSKTIENMLSLLTLPDNILEAVREGTLPVSQGYLFAANLYCPDLSDIFEDIAKNHVANAILKDRLSAYKNVGSGSGSARPVPMEKQFANLQTLKTGIETGAGIYLKSDLEKLLEELKAFLSLVEEQVKTAPESVPVKERRVRKKAA